MLDANMATRLLFAAMIATAACFIAGPSTPVARAVEPESWQSSTSIATARVQPATALLHDGRVLVVGGQDWLGTIYSSAELFNPATGTWAAAAPMTVARFGHTATTLSDGRVLVVGEWYGDRSAEIYDPATNMWSSAGQTAAHHVIHAATLLNDGRVLVTGGTTFPSVTAASEIYDPLTNDWSSAGSMAYPRAWHRATLLDDGRVLITGGSGQFTVPIDSEYFDPATESWSIGPAMSVPRHASSATKLATGDVLVVGGYGTEARATAEIYRAGLATWELVTEPPNARYHHEATLLPDGRVITAGGTLDNATGLTSSDVYDPVQNQWASVGPMASARLHFRMERAGKRVYAIAGGAGPGQALNTVEHFQAEGVFVPPSAGTYLAVDCDVVTPGIQLECDFDATSPEWAVDIVIGNVDFVSEDPWGPTAVGAFRFDLLGSDQFTFDPQVPITGVPTTQGNPNLSEGHLSAVGNWACYFPYPTPDADPNPFVSRSRLGCASSDGFPLPPGGSAILARVHFNVLRSGPATFSLSDVAVGTANGFEIASCEPVSVIPSTCHDASVAVSYCPDTDCDLVADQSDNCPSVANPTQINTDRNTITLTPDRAFDDATRANSDVLGDACDSDDDNDGLSDADEASGAACGGVITESTLADTDGDRMIDRAECLTVGRNPLAAEATLATCNAPGDADGDGVLDSREFCFYGTSASNINTDGDNCSDRREIMSINADFTVNALDLSQVAQAFGPYEVGAPAYKYNFDVTKDGTINALDLSQVAQAFGACP